MSKWFEKEAAETPQATPAATEPAPKYYQVCLVESRQQPYQRAGFRFSPGEAKLMSEHELGLLKIDTPQGFVYDPLLSITEVKP